MVKIIPFVPRGSRSVRINYKGIGAGCDCTALAIDNCRNSNPALQIKLINININ